MLPLRINAQYATTFAFPLEIQLIAVDLRKISLGSAPLSNHTNVFQKRFHARLSMLDASQTSGTGEPGLLFRSGDRG